MILTDGTRADFDIPGLSSPEEARSKQQIIVLPHNGFTLPGGLSVAWREATSRYIRAALHEIQNHLVTLGLYNLFLNYHFQYLSKLM